MFLEIKPYILNVLCFCTVCNIQPLKLDRSPALFPTTLCLNLWNSHMNILHFHIYYAFLSYSTFNLQLLCSDYPTQTSDQPTYFLSFQICVDLNQLQKVIYGSQDWAQQCPMTFSLCAQIFTHLITILYSTILEFSLTLVREKLEDIEYILFVL